MKGEPKIVRPVLLERCVVERGEFVAFGRALWGSTGRVEFKAWLGGPAIRGGQYSKEVGEVASRSRSTKGVRDPMSGQEWAFHVWDEYLRDVRVAIGVASAP